MQKRKIFHYKNLESTNTKAGEMAKNGGPHGTIVLADEQSAGRGRFGRHWHSPKGKGLWFSMILRPKLDPMKISQLTLVAAVALAEGISDIYGLNLGIKWPNDLQADGKKISGILSEGKIEGKTFSYVILGIGLNLSIKENQDLTELKKATSLEDQIGRIITEKEKTDLLNEILDKIEKWYNIWLEDGFEPVRVAWKEKSVTLGQRVFINQSENKFYAEALDIDENGALVVEKDDGEILALNSGEISLRPKEEV